MKKIISIIMIALVGLSIIPKTLVNEKHVVLESTTSVYTKEEVDSLLSAIRTNITNNTNELTNIKSELTALQNSLKDYALKTSLNTTNSNIDGLNTIVTDNTARIEALEASSGSITPITISQRTSSWTWYCDIIVGNVESATFLVKKTGNGGVTFGGVAATTEGVEVTVEGNKTYTFSVSSTDSATFTYGYLTQIK